MSWRAAGKARTAAEAAKDAAEQAQAESRRRFESYAAGRLRDNAHRVISFLNRHEWGKAAILLRELGEDAGHFAVQDATWNQSVDDLHQMAAACDEWEAKKRKKGHSPKWNLRLNEVLAKLPVFHKPA